MLRRGCIVWSRSLYRSLDSTLCCTNIWPSVVITAQSSRQLHARPSVSTVQATFPEERPPLSVTTHFGSNHDCLSRDNRGELEDIQSQLSPAIIQELDQIVEQLGDDQVLLFRVGDYYRLYGERSTRWSNSMGLGQFEDKCFNGFPSNYTDKYIGDLIQQGIKVAIVDHQGKRNRRAFNHNTQTLGVVRIVTSGTYLGSQTGAQTRLLMCIGPPIECNDNINDETYMFGMAYCDISMGTVRCATTSQEGLTRSIRAIAPAEIILPTSLLALAEKTAHGPNTIVKCFSQLHDILRDIPTTYRDDNFFLVEVDTELNLRLPFECRSALRGLARYIDETFVNELPCLQKPVYIDLNTTLLDLSALHNLNVLPNSANAKKTSLCTFLDQTYTKAGAKLLKTRLAAPFHDINLIEARFNYIDLITQDEDLNTKVDSVLGSLSKSTALDLAVQKILTAGDLTKESLYVDLVRHVRVGLQLLAIDQVNAAVQSFNSGVPDLVPLAHFFDSLIDLDRKNGFIIKLGYSKVIDTLCAQRGSLTNEIQQHFVEFLSKHELSRDVCALHFASEDLPTHIKLPMEYHKKLRLKHTCEINEENETMMLFYQPMELPDTRLAIVNEELRNEIEEILMYARDKIKYFSPLLFSLHDMIAEIDVIHGLAKLAKKHGFTRPKLTTKPIIQFKDGYHPIVHERCIEEGRESVTNDCAMDGKTQCVQVLSGPNMGGKSTFIRQVGIMCLMAQIGSFVPASEATLGIFDTIFARFGSHDDLVEARSSFMFEILEINHALKHATPRSLILIDELGRGTTPLDGVSLSVAVAHWLSKRGIRALMTTHHHELYKQLKDHISSEEFSRLDFRHSSLIQSATKDEKCKIDYKIRSGMSQQSYGLEIATWSDLPAEVLKTAFAIRDSEALIKSTN